MPPFLPVLVLMLATVLPPAAGRAETLQALAVAGTAFRLTLDDGTVLPDAAWAATTRRTEKEESGTHPQGTKTRRRLPPSILCAFVSLW